MNSLFIDDMKFHAYHGCLEEEARLGQLYTVGVKIESDFAEASATDELDSAADYEEVFRICETEMSLRSNLIETVAARISHRLGARFSWAETIEVNIEKPNPPIEGRGIGAVRIQWVWSK